MGLGGVHTGSKLSRGAQPIGPCQSSLDAAPHPPFLLLRVPPALPAPLPPLPPPQPAQRPAARRYGSGGGGYLDLELFGGSEGEGGEEPGGDPEAGVDAIVGMGFSPRKVRFHWRALCGPASDLLFRAARVVWPVQGDGLWGRGGGPPRALPHPAALPPAPSDAPPSLRRAAHYASAATVWRGPWSGCWCTAADRAGKEPKGPRRQRLALCCRGEGFG
jgi:hypothetical protein